MFLDSRNSILDSRSSILASRNSNVSTFETRESSFEDRVETVNLHLTGTVHPGILPGDEYKAALFPLNDNKYEW